MVLHGSHEYTPVMLAFFYQHQPDPVGLIKPRPRLDGCTWTAEVEDVFSSLKSEAQPSLPRLLFHSVHPAMKKCCWLGGISLHKNVGDVMLICYAYFLDGRCLTGAPSLLTGKFANGHNETVKFCAVEHDSQQLRRSGWQVRTTLEIDEIMDVMVIAPAYTRRSSHDQQHVWHCLTINHEQIIISANYWVLDKNHALVHSNYM